MKMKEKLMKFMQGRYGVDQFAKFTIGAAFVLVVLAIFIGRGNLLGTVMDTVGLLLIIYTYFRIFSRNISRRYGENQKYLEKTASLRARLRKEKNIMSQRKDYHIYTCPGCGQKIRIPRGKGKIEISCPKCRTKFVKKS